MSLEVSNDEAHRAPEEWLREVDVTFDSHELCAFFSVFEPLELNDDLFSTPVDDPRN